MSMTGDLVGAYVVEERWADGRLVLRPDLRVETILARHSEKELTRDEFDRRFGRLPTDDEG